MWKPLPKEVQIKKLGLKKSLHLKLFFNVTKKKNISGL